MEQRDMIILGAGPGGYETAIEAAARGLRVTLVERGRVGGTCLNRGCIPTKALCATASVIETVASAAAYGVEVPAGTTASWAAARARMEQVVATLRQGVEASLKGVELVRGTGSITPEGHVAVDTEGAEGPAAIYSAPTVIIATGSAPAALPIPGAGLCITSDQLLTLDTLPASMAIIGGGVIGLEFADILNAFGVEVTVLEYCKEVLPAFDPDVAKRLRTDLQRKGIRFVTSARVTSVSDSADAGAFTVSYEGRKGAESLGADCVLMAVGRRPVLPEGLEAAGIAVERRAVKVDPATLATSRPGIYCIGDANGLCMLAHAATAQGRVVLGDKVDLQVVPSAVFTRPECATVGLGADRARELYGDTLTVRQVMYGASGKALAMGHPRGVVKVLLHEGRFVGASILGAHASDLIQEIATVMAAGLPATAVADAIHAHPTLSELVMLAAR